MAWTADGRWIPEDDSVASNLNGLLASNGKYMQTARAAGTRTAARRGLLNSSIAGGAAESAAIAAAAPIASQDASQTFQRNQAVLEGGITLNNQKDVNQQQYGFQTNLNAQQNTAQSERDTFAADAQTKRDLFAQQGATEQQLREFDQRTEEQVRQLSSSERTSQMNADTSLTATQINANTAIAGQYLDAFSKLADNPNIPADVRNSYVTEFQRVLNQSRALTGVVQATPLDWGAGAQPTAQGAANVPASSLTSPPPAPAPAPVQSVPARQPVTRAELQRIRHQGGVSASA